MDISIIVPLYKGQKYVDRILGMVQANKRNLYENYAIELIFVNDFPAESIVLPDMEENVIDKVGIFVNETNVGIHQSKINGLRMASGKWIMFLDQDDTIADTYLASQIGKANGYDAIVSNGYWRNGEEIYSETYPLQYPFSFDGFLEYGYPLISLGQLLIQKKSIPTEWIQKPLRHNGCDDLYLWALLMAYHVKVAANDALIYTHVEDGGNASMDFREMRLSIENVKEKFISLDCTDGKRKNLFSKMMDGIASKYDQYEKLDGIFGNADSKKIEANLRDRNIQKVAVYGIGIYGKALLKNLEKTGIEVLYGIDKRADVKNVGIPVIGIDSGMEPVDAVIVTPVFDFANICSMLKSKTGFAGQIICLDEIL